MTRFGPDKWVKSKVSAGVAIRMALQPNIIGVLAGVPGKLEVQGHEAKTNEKHERSLEQTVALGRA